MTFETEGGGRALACNAQYREYRNQSLPLIFDPPISGLRSGHHDSVVCASRQQATYDRATVNLCVTSLAAHEGESVLLQARGKLNALGNDVDPVSVVSPDPSSSQKRPEPTSVTFPYAVASKPITSTPPSRPATRRWLRDNAASNL